MSVATRKMHQTTVRFSTDLWAALEDECEGLGVSVAQYVREAALARLTYAAGERGDIDIRSVPPSQALGTRSTSRSPSGPRAVRPAGGPARSAPVGRSFRPPAMG